MPYASLSSAWLAVALIAAYALGGISPGWWIVRRAGGGDIRARGSGTTGATNVGRVLGERGFLAVLALDALKGGCAVAGARVLVPASPWSVLAFPAVVAGHIWPIWLGFRGGRGAGPLLGGCIALSVYLALCSVVAGLAILAATRQRFLAGAVAFTASVVFM